MFSSNIAQVRTQHPGSIDMCVWQCFEIIFHIVHFSDLANYLFERLQFNEITEDVQCT